MVHTDRRGFLKHGLVAAGGLGLGLVAWSRLARQGTAPEIHDIFGPLAPVKDQTTGLPVPDTDTAADWAQATAVEDNGLDAINGKKVQYPGWDL